MTWLKLFLIVGISMSIRYFLITGLAYRAFWKWGAAWSKRNRLQNKDFQAADIRRELTYSALSLLMYAFVFSIPFTSLVRPYTQLYDHVSDYGVAWWFISLIGLIVVNDTYFYWMHRTVHWPALFRRIHRVHHQSTNPTPFAAFSFHPFEAFLEFIWIVPLFFIVPMHVGMTIVFSVLSLLMNVIGHLGVEIYPDRWRGHPVLSWLNRSTFHNDHHRLFRGNYGLYFTFWDRVMGTLEQNPLPALRQSNLATPMPELKNRPSARPNPTSLPQQKQQEIF
jgi:sterol desaturase/sphingolipid hydroxylase (fatty acid hydroxylase superfamily)